MLPAGIVTQKSPYGVKDTIDRLQSVLSGLGITVYARINQQEELAKVGIEIHPLEFILFGNPKAGGPVMTQNVLAALELPLKIIAWEDAQQQVWLAYSQGSYIKERYGLSEEVSAPLHLDKLVSRIFT
jgi:uncharacterized protein (DUF302 family)